MRVAALSTAYFTSLKNVIKRLFLVAKYLKAEKVGGLNGWLNSKYRKRAKINSMYICMVKFFV